MAKPVEPVVLDRDWDVSALIGGTFKLFWRHAALFLPLTAIIVFPFVIAFDVLLSGDDLVEDDIDPGRLFGSVLAGLFTFTVMPALVTALHVVSVIRIGEGERPSVREALALGSARFGAAIGATILYLLAIILGFILLIIPGIYLSVRLYLAAQAAVVDDRSPGDALRRSAELVKGRWWQTFGRLLLAGIVFGLVTAPLTGAVALMEYSALYVVLDAAAQTIGLSLTAIFGTLVFMDYRSPSIAEPAAYSGFEPPQPPTPQRFG